MYCDNKLVARSARANFRDVTAQKNMNVAMVAQTDVKRQCFTCIQGLYVHATETSQNRETGRKLAGFESKVKTDKIL